MKHVNRRTRRRRSGSLKKAHTIRYFTFYCLWVFLSIAVLYTQTPRCHWMRFFFRFLLGDNIHATTTTTSIWIECGFVDRNDDLFFHRVLYGSDGSTGMRWKVKTIRYCQPLNKRLKRREKMGGEEIVSHEVLRLRKVTNYFWVIHLNIRRRIQIQNDNEQNRKEKRRRKNTNGYCNAASVCYGQNSYKITLLFYDTTTMIYTMHIYISRRTKKVCMDGIFFGYKTNYFFFFIYHLQFTEYLSFDHFSCHTRTHIKPRTRVQHTFLIDSECVWSWVVSLLLLLLFWLIVYAKNTSRIECNFFSR